MILDDTTAPHLLTNKNQSSLMGVHYDKALHRLTATDGRALVRVAVRDDEEDETGVIPVEAFKEALKLARGRNALPPEIKAKSGAARLRDGRTYPLLAIQFPSVEQVFPRVENWARRARIKLGVELLRTLALAAGAANGLAVELTFEVDEDGDATRGAVSVKVGNATAAVIMPIRMSKAAEKKASDIEPA